ncbi:MAG: helix-turn-helix transcriptional regulator, partial [Eubacteriales bacterium]|nr:helix-turn-helix transcriptional regulator [Eubacteriales bacterium]
RIICMKNIKIAENIRFFRKQAGLTQEELAARFGSRKTLISNYEIGRNTPDIETLWELADIFDITIDELVGRE